ncbi:MAG: glutaminyl-peptide cyclotransferase [Candidatus Promineifilaceae bacterium]
MRHVILLLLMFVAALLAGCDPAVAQTVAEATTSRAAVETTVNTEPSTPTVPPLSPATVVAMATPVMSRTSSPQPPLVSPTLVATSAPYPMEGATQEAEPVWGYRIINAYPHDTSAFTQGLVVDEDPSLLLEGTGGDSSLRRVLLQTGTVRQEVTLPDIYFGEGITLFNDKIFQLTWRSEKGFIYDAEDLVLMGEFSYPHEGWGLTHDGEFLIVSDGTNVIRFWDPLTFEEVRRIEVRSHEGAIDQLNELEFVNGEIWANVWHSDLIARISPDDGRVLGWIDLSGLMDAAVLSSGQAVLNGIAYDSANDRLYVTGKLWPSLFEIEVVVPDNY